MTRERAIEIIQTEWKCVDRQGTPKCNRDCANCDLVMETEEIRQAYNMAIQALEQEPTTKDYLAVDCISRQAAIDAVMEVHPYYLYECENGYRVVKAQDVMSLIRRLPSVFPARPKGKWDTYVISMVDGEGCKCSECGFEGVPYWNFCPNCGDMKVEQNLEYADNDTAYYGLQSAT